MRALLMSVLVLTAWGVRAQYAPGAGSGFAGFGNAGGFGGGGGGAIVARVVVAPGGFNNGLQGLNGGGGGLRGVTRPTFMGEPNFIAAQYFQSGGVPVNAQLPAVPNAAGAGGNPGAFYGQTAPGRAGGNPAMAPAAAHPSALVRAVAPETPQGETGVAAAANAARQAQINNAAAQRAAARQRAFVRMPLRYRR